MRTRDLQKLVFEACIELLDSNIITTIPYIFFIILDTVIKGLYGIAFNFYFVKGSGVQFLQNEEAISFCVFASTGYLMLILIMLIIIIFTRGEVSNLFRGLIRKVLLVCLKANNTFLMVPLQVITFQCFRLGIQNSFSNFIQVYHLALSILSLVIQVSLFLFTETFLFCFFPNKNIPWSKPSTGIDLMKYAINVTFSILLIFDHESNTIDIILFIFISCLQMFGFLLVLFQIPYYSLFVDTAIVAEGLTLSYIYIFAILKGILHLEQGKVSFDLVFSFTLFVLLFCIYKVRTTQIERTFLKSHKSMKDFKIQLVELIRLSNRGKLDMVISLQSWIIQHKQTCNMGQCLCIQFKLHEIQNVNSRAIRQIQNNDSEGNNNEGMSVQNYQEDIVYQDVSLFSAVQQEFYMSQFLEDLEMLSNENPRDFEKRQLQKLQSMVILLINSEIEENGKIDTQLQFMKICVDIFLKNQSYRAFFKILQLQQSLIKLTMKQEFILAYLKKFLINKMNMKEKYKKNSEKVFILNQLKFEQSFQKFIIDVQRVTEVVDNLWKQSASRNYKIIAMTEMMDKISHDYITIWTKYQEIEGKYLNAELLLVLARFCDMVMGFELEAENLYSKGTSLLNSIKLQQQKGQIIEENIENKIKSQELLFNVQCSPKCLDKISFANQKFLQWVGHKIEDIPVVKNLLPSIIAQFHDDKIMTYLQQHEKTSSKINVQSWIKTKQGHVIPIEIKSIPYIDLKHDLRFITLIKQMRDFEVDETKHQYHQAFIFLVNSYGRIDSASEECHTILNIGQKMIDNGLSLHQIFQGFDFDRVSDYQNGQEFQLDKRHLIEIQQSLDIQQDQLQGQSFKFGSIIFSPADTKRLLMSEVSIPIYMKVYIKCQSYGNIDQTYYEVFAIPTSSDINLSMAISHQKLNTDFKSSQLSHKQDMVSDQIAHKGETGLHDESEENNIGSQSSITSSQTSRSDKQFQLIRDIKEITSLKGMPPLILKLKKALNVFFFVMLVTAIVLLIVNIVDKVSFKQDIQAVEEAFRIQYYVSNVRLRFLYLFTHSNEPVDLTYARIEKYHLIQRQLGIYVENFRLTINNLGRAVQLLDSELKGLFFDNDLFLEEVSKAGMLYNLTTSFQSGCQEVIGKADSYQYSNISTLKIERPIFAIQYGTNKTGSYRLTNDEINTFFIVNNLANSIRKRADKIEEQFSSEVIDFGVLSEQNILIFTIVCVTVVIIASIMILPMLFTIDNNLRESIRTWTQIRQEQKEEQINKIQQFKDFLELTDFLNEKKGKKYKGVKLSPQKAFTKATKNDKPTKGVISNPRANKYISQMIYNEDMLDDDREEVKENYHNDSKRGQPGKNKVKDSQADFSHIVDHDDNNNKKQKQGNKQGKGKFNESESEDDINRQNGINNNDLDQIQEVSAVETEAERIHKLSQIITLNKYTFQRKIKMASIIIIFSVILCSMYVGSYLLASKIYDQTLEDFEILTIVSNRSPCVARNFFFLMETYVKNQTIENDENSVSQLLEVCKKVEQDIRALKKDQKLSYEKIKNSINQVDSKQFCQFYANEISSNYAENESERLQLVGNCSLVKSGLLNLGVSQVINTMYHDIEQANIFFTNTKGNTVKQLQALLYDKGLDTLLSAYLTYLGPTLDKIQKLANASLYEVLEAAFNNLIVMFTIFLLFLLVTWYFSIRYLIRTLSQTLARSKISVKMIPANILIAIKEAQNQNNPLSRGSHDN